MPRYKITKIFVVDASDKQEAFQKLKTEQDALKHLEYVSIKDLSAEQGEWTNAIKQQLTGQKK